MVLEEKRSNFESSSYDDLVQTTYRFGRPLKNVLKVEKKTSKVDNSKTKG